MNKGLQFGGFIIAALVIIAATVLISLGHEVPGELWTFGGVAIGVGGGATVPKSA